MAKTEERERDLHDLSMRVHEVVQERGKGGWSSWRVRAKRKKGN
jgi:hypothetical protein